MKPARIESIAELRRRCQDPVRVYNDLTGALYGWRFSIHLTRLFLSLGLTASFASVAMVVTGIGGSLVCLLGGPWIVVGLAALTTSYVLDCVDGEMARYRGIDSFRWAGIDYLHHLLTKGLSFLCLGVGLFREVGNPWLIAAGATCSVFWLLLMGLRDLPLLLFGKKLVMNERRAENPAVQRMQRNLAELHLKGTDSPPARDIWGAEFRFRPWVIRTFFTAFDIVVPLLLLTSIADRFVPRFELSGLPFSITGAVVSAYAVLLPLHFIDSVNTAMRGKQVRNELYQLADRVEWKQAPPAGPVPSVPSAVENAKR